MVKNTSFILSSLLTLTLFSGCASAPKEETVGAPPVGEAPSSPRQRVDRISLAEKPEAPKQLKPEPTFRRDGWPANETDRSFSLKWTAPTKTTRLFEAPSLNADTVDDVKFQEGQQLTWSQSQVAVFKAKTYVAKEAVKLEGILMSEGYRTGNDFEVLDMYPAQSLQLFGYAGDGQCFVAKSKDKVLKAPCPSDTKFAGEFYPQDPSRAFQAEKQIWWVYLSTDAAEGWYPVDKNIEVQFY